MAPSHWLDRRGFLVSAAATGSAFVLRFDVAAAHSSAAEPLPELTAWVSIGYDDSVQIRVARSDMGQGISTALPMLVAEELECDWSKVTATYVSPEENIRRGRIWGRMSTSASRSVAFSQHDMRLAGATARMMLIAAAAERWNAPSAECTAAASLITHRPSGRPLRFGEIARQAATMKPPTKIALKKPTDWKLIGRPQKHLGALDKILGKAIYGIDVRVPYMLY